MENLVSIEQLSTKTNLPKSWWYARTRQKGEGTVPYIRCGKYLRFELEEAVEWLKRQGETGGNKLCNQKTF